MTKISLIGIVLCATVLSPMACDKGLEVRYVIWGLLTLVMFLSLNTNKIDFGVTRTMMFKALTCLLLFSFLSCFKSINLNESLYGLLKLCVWFMFFLCLSVTIDKDVIADTFTLLAIGLGILGLYQLGVWMSGTDVLGVDTPNEVTGTMCNKNLWSECLLLLLPFCVYRGKFLGVLASSLIVANILVLFTRNAILGLFIYSLAWAMFYPKHRRLVMLCVTALFLSLYLLIPNLIPNALWSLNQRWDIWQQSLIMSWDNIWLGVGIDNWRIAIPQYASGLEIPDAYKTVFFQRPHNDFIWVLSETGIFGLLSYLSMFGLTFYYSWKTKNKLVFVAMAGCVTCAFFSFPKERVFGSMVPLILMALATLEYHREYGSAMRVSHKAVLRTTAIAVPVLCLAIVCFTNRYMATCFVKNLRTTTRTNVELASLDYDFTFTTLDFTSTPLNYYGGMSKYGVGDFGCARLELEKAYKANPNHIFVLNNLANVIGSMGDIKGATLYLERAQRIKPTKLVGDNIEFLETR